MAENQNKTVEDSWTNSCQMVWDKFPIAVHSRLCLLEIPSEGEESETEVLEMQECVGETESQATSDPTSDVAKETVELQAGAALTVTFLNIINYAMALSGTALMTYIF